MNKRATETILINTLVDSMSKEDLQQYVANDMKDFLQYCSESEVINEFLIKIKYMLDEQFYNQFVKQNKEQLLWTKEQTKST